VRQVHVGLESFWERFKFNAHTVAASLSALSRNRTSSSIFWRSVSCSRTRSFFHSVISDIVVGAPASGHL